ncbi:MAG: phosphomannomutase/phosphoglucomutase [Candidatus Methanofastidiosum sp.]|nr:phosphomannomutase/phosphoglucomutase [Methanofastidiosum sp.]
MIFKLYDIRGHYPDEIDEKFAYSLGRTFGKLYKNILFGIDSRISSEKFKDPFVTGVINEGSKISYAGMISTPLMYFLTKKNFDIGVIATASHNPKEFGGFKVCGIDGLPLSPINQIKPIFKEYELSEIFENAEDYKIDFETEYTNYYLKKFENAKDYKIVVDFSSGASVVERKILDIIFKNKSFLSFVPDGNFPDHVPNTMTPDCLENIINKVLEEKADIGIIFDGDGDRIGIIDEKGHPIRGDILTAIIAEQLLSESKGNIIYDLRCSNIVPETIISKGGTPIKSRVGHYFIKKLMKEKDAIFAGELSNHFYFMEIGGFEAPLLALLYILKSIENNTLSNVADKYSKYYQSGELNFEVPDKYSKMNEILTNFSEGAVEKIDGISIYYKDWWLNVRPSNTESLLRVNIESNNQEILYERIRDVKKIMNR